MKLNIVMFILHLLHLAASDDDPKKHHGCCQSVDVPDYYWREYCGDIPYDAVPGGKDKLGRTTYIGQALVLPYGQLPASIYQGNKTAVASAALKTHYADKNVKILCSESLQKFEWIATNTDKIQLITNCDLVLGGVDVGYQENIGRINYKEETILGKVIRKPLNHDGLWVPDNESEIKFKTYEVLAYGCEPIVHNLSL